MTTAEPATGRSRHESGLDDSECRQLLASKTLGRVAVTINALPAIFPVRYAVVDGDITFSVSDDPKLRTALNNVVVAFEVSDADPGPPHGWTVLAIGVARSDRQRAATD